MAINAREPRLPLEPEEYPLYKPPRRIGCSGLTIVTLIFVAAFVLLFWRVTPDIARAIVNFPLTIFQQGTPQANGVSASATQTALAQPTLPVPVAASPTPFIEYVKVANTGNAGVALRVEPLTGARNLVPGNVGEGAVLRVIGPDQPDRANPSNIWRNVQLLPPDGRKGWILSKFLIPDKGPNQ
jgi:hypothetical protein